MSPPLTRDEVLRIARLAHLELSDADVDLFTRQLADILAHASDVQRIDTTGVAPTAHALTTGPGWRDDTPVASLDRRAALSNAPDARQDAGLFRVPKVL
jgi:aspartyl-tRNA(Asn)/glutamyl-tRNA(Gln) amidotransferase subunit C